MYLSSNIYRFLVDLLVFVFIGFPHLVLSQSLNDSLMGNSLTIAQTYISDPYLNELLIQGMEKGIQGDYQGAIVLFTEILQFNPNEVEAYYNRGIAYGKIEAYQAAITDFNQALTLNQTMPDLYIERAKIYLQLGDRTAAIADLKKAKALLRQQGETSRYSEVDSLLNSR
ncbi:MAG: tetratricopeptide repeat protein [Crocosphaera sp.]|nr:tetratricopeptide repeat protein [Crocosphaera sp.]